jgi:hypothetical protein
MRTIWISETTRWRLGAGVSEELPYTGALRSARIGADYVRFMTLSKRGASGLTELASRRAPHYITAITGTFIGVSG